MVVELSRSSIVSRDEGLPHDSLHANPFTADQEFSHFESVLLGD